MEYKDSAEYVYDLLEHEYKTVDVFIHMIGADKFNIYVPDYLKTNLEATTFKGDIIYPTKYRGMNIKFAPVVKPLFALKGKDV